MRKQEKPGHSISHALGWEMPLKIEKKQQKKNQENTLKSVDHKSLDNIELLPFDPCFFIFLQLQTNELIV